MKPLQVITPYELQQLSARFTRHGKSYPDFPSFWWAFLDEQPPRSTIVEVMNHLEQWGYCLSDL